MTMRNADQISDKQRSAESKGDVMVKVDLSQTEILKLPLEIRRRILADGAEAFTMDQLLELEQSLESLLFHVNRKFWDLKTSKGE